MVFGKERRFLIMPSPPKFNQIPVKVTRCGEALLEAEPLNLLEDWSKAMRSMHWDWHQGGSCRNVDAVVVGPRLNRYSAMPHHAVWA